MYPAGIIMKGMASSDVSFASDEVQRNISFLDEGFVMQ